MSLIGKVLIIDDAPLFLETFRDVLTREGYVVDTATDRQSALSQLDREWDAVLLDLKLQGPEGPSDGMDLLSEIQLRAPFAQIIMVTGFADPMAINEAFSKGVYDLLEKDGRNFRALLLAKVRNVVELARERLGNEEKQAIVQQTWFDVQSEGDRGRKGLLLEQLMLFLFESIPGFTRITPRSRNRREEIDLLIMNESQDALWRQEGAYFLAECKNWSSPAGAPEFRDFHGKLKVRYGRCRVGFFIAPGGFARTFAEASRQHSTDELLVIPIGPTDLGELVHANDRNEKLKELHQRAMMAQNGHHV